LIKIYSSEPCSENSSVYMFENRVLRKIFGIPMVIDLSLLSDNFQN
jgi:hypothetical protein